MTQPSLLKRFSSVLGHPLFLLAVGSVVGSLLIPPISDGINRKKVAHEARLRTAVEIVDNNTTTVSQLNGMVTRLTSFHENNIARRPSPAKLMELQEKLAEDMDNRWLEFDKTAWWWCEALNSEAVILGIIPAPGAGLLRQHVDAYKQNILETSNVMKELKEPCISADYDYKGSRVSDIKLEVQEKLSKLMNARNQLVNNLVSDFTEQK